MKYLLALLLLVSSAFAQFTVNGSHTISGLGGLGTIGVITCTTITQSGALPGAVQNVAYSTTITASGGTLPYTWSLIGGSLPTGLTATQSGNSYVISGTPTAVQTSSFTVQVKDSGSCTAVQSTLSIAVAASNALTLQSNTLPSVVTGNVYPTSLLVATGGTAPYQSCSVIAGALPGGLSISTVNATPSGCQISGTVSGGASTYNFTVQIKDSASPQHTTSRAYSITVVCASCGPPVAYTHARTDLCETGLESGCSGKGMIFDGSPATMSQVPVLWETSITASCASPPCHRVGLNKTATDPDFGAFLIRASDKFSPCNNGSVGIKGADGGDVPWIGLTDTTLSVPSAMFLTASSGSKMCLSYYKPSTHTVLYSRIQGGGGNNGTTTQFATGASVAMSGTQPKHMFELISLKAQDVINDLTIDNDPSHTTTFDTITRTPYRDLINGGADCLPASYATRTTSPWTGTFNVSGDDTAITVGFSSVGGQGTGFEAVRVSASKSGCRYFVFAGASTGVKGDFGCHYTAGAGMGTCTADTPGVTYGFVTDNQDICTALVTAGINGSPALPCHIDDQFLLHGLQQSPDPAWFSTGVNNSTCVNGHTCSCNHNGTGNIGGCQEYFFNGDTNLVEPCSVCAGHNANGFAFAYKQPGGGVSPLRRISRAVPTVGSAPPTVLGSPNPGTIMSPSLPADYHGSYNNADTVDGTPMALALADVSSTNTQGFGWTNRPAYPGALYGEIIACSTVTIGTCFRLNHSFNSTLEQSFSPVENIFIMSPEGTWGYMMTDLMGNFGSYTDLNTCNMVGGDGYKTAHTYAVNDEITTLPPVAHGANAHNTSFLVTTAGTSSGTLPPALNGVAFKAGTYALNTYIIPDTNNAGLNIFQVTFAGSSGTEPNWDSACSTTCSGAGGTAVYTKVTQPIVDGAGPLAFTFEGRNDCSGDAVIVDLTPLI